MEIRSQPLPAELIFSLFVKQCLFNRTKGIIPPNDINNVDSLI